MKICVLFKVQTTAASEVGGKNKIKQRKKSVPVSNVTDSESHSMLQLFKHQTTFKMHQRIKMCIYAYADTHLGFTMQLSDHR